MQDMQLSLQFINEVSDFLYGYCFNYFAEIAGEANLPDTFKACFRRYSDQGPVEMSYCRNSIAAEKESFDGSSTLRAHHYCSGFLNLANIFQLSHHCAHS